MLSTPSNRSGGCTLRSRTDAALDPSRVLSTYQRPTSWFPRWRGDLALCFSLKIFWQYTSSDLTYMRIHNAACSHVIVHSAVNHRSPHKQMTVRLWLGVLSKSRAYWDQKVSVMLYINAQLQYVNNPWKCTAPESARSLWCEAKVYSHIKPLWRDGASCLGFLIT